MYDGDQQRYLQLLANGGEKEAVMDASDIDSSDVASSDDIDSNSDDSDADAPLAGGVSSTSKGEGRGKRGRSQIGLSEGTLNEPHPLLTEIASKSERRQVATTRWFSDPLFDEANTLGASPTGGSVAIGEDQVEQPSLKRPRRGQGAVRQPQDNFVIPEGGSGGAAEALLASMPKTEKEKRKEKRKKVSFGVW